MKKSKRISILISIGIFSVLVLSVSMSQSAAYPGFSKNADCNTCHNEPSNAAASYNSSATINLDGNSTEAIWSNTTYKRMEIPVACANQSVQSGVAQLVEVVFAQNATTLFILVNWASNNITGNDAAMAKSDGFALCWNINVTNYTAAYFSGMVAPAAGEAVNTILWQPLGNQTGLTPPSNGGKSMTVQGQVWNYHFDSTGWHNNVGNSTKAAAIFGKAKFGGDYFQVELERPLKTSDPGDEQFTTAQYHQFAIAILNATSGRDHYVSFVHQTYVYFPPTSTSTTEGFPVWILGALGIAAIAVISIMTAKKTRKHQE